jgi:hypothetical protein
MTAFPPGSFQAQHQAILGNADIEHRAFVANSAGREFLDQFADGWSFAPATTTAGYVFLSKRFAELVEYQFATESDDWRRAFLYKQLEYSQQGLQPARLVAGLAILGGWVHYRAQQVRAQRATTTDHKESK